MFNLWEMDSFVVILSQTRFVAFLTLSFHEVILNKVKNITQIFLAFSHYFVLAEVPNPNEVQLKVHAWCSQF